MSQPKEELPESQEVCPESPDTGDVNERIAATGFKKHIYFSKSIGVAIVFAFLTYWLSESAFRPPPVDSEPKWEWKGWVTALNERRNWLRGPKEECGPIYKMMIFFTTNKMERKFLDTRAVTHWVLFCLIVGIGIAIKRIRSWKKRFHEDEAYHEPIVNPSLLKKIKYAALIMGMLILCLEVRNGLRRSQRATNLQLLLAAQKGNVEDVRSRLSAGADVDVKAWGFIGDDSWRMRARKLSEEDLALFNSIYGTTALHAAAQYGHTNVVELLLSNGANVNAIDASDMTPLDLALMGVVFENDSNAIAKLLKKHGGKMGRELRNE